MDPRGSFDIRDVAQSACSGITSGVISRRLYSQPLIQHALIIGRAFACFADCSNGSFLQ
jgi:hypothetical protein